MDKYGILKRLAYIGLSIYIAVYAWVDLGDLRLLIIASHWALLFHMDESDK
jgi:hypothetical protein